MAHNATFSDLQQSLHGQGTAAEQVVVMVAPENVTIVAPAATVQTRAQAGPSPVQNVPTSAGAARAVPGYVQQAVDNAVLRPRAAAGTVLASPQVVYQGDATYAGTGTGIITNTYEAVVFQPLQVSQLPANRASSEDSGEAMLGYGLMAVGWACCCLAFVVPFAGLFVGVWLIMPLLHLCRSPEESRRHPRARTAAWWNLGSLIAVVMVLMMIVITAFVFCAEEHHHQGPYGPHHPHHHPHHYGPEEPHHHGGMNTTAANTAGQVFQF